MSIKQILAVDLGASSGRVMKGLFDGKKIEFSEVHRFNNGAIPINGSLHWDVLNLFQHIKEGIIKSSEDKKFIGSIAIDTWGVDYCYLDKDGDLIANPHCYRDQRTTKYENEFYQKLSKKKLFKETGVQPALINSINQIHADLAMKPYLRNIVDKVLFMPDYLNYLLSNQMINEYTILSTSGLLDANTRELSSEIMDRVGIPSHWFPNIVKGGQILGPLTSELRAELNRGDIQVIAGASHDTASAVMAIPYSHVKEETAFISCGTWSLVGIERREPVITDEAFHAGLTNEGTFDGKYRILKNTTGLWIYNELRREWSLKGNDKSHDDLTALANEVNNNQIYINPNDDSFSTPGNMEEKIRKFCQKTNQETPKTTGEFIRIILESLAMSYRNTIEQLESITGQSIQQIQMVGGGIKNKLLCQFTADFTKRKVVAGPVEASSLGNMVTQLNTLGLVNSREEINEVIKNSSEVKYYTPREINDLEEKFNQFISII